MSRGKTFYPKGLHRQIKMLNALTTGPAAVTLPNEIRLLALQFTSTTNGVPTQSQGAFDFWKQKLPPVQFYNPNLPISVRRLEQPPKEHLQIEYVDGQIKEVETLGKTAEEIFAELVSLSGAQQVPKSDLVEIVLK